MRGFAWWGVIVVMFGVLSTPLACDDTSSTEQGCLQQICNRYCRGDADCPEYQFCAPRDFFTGTRQCQTGCRDDSQCAPEFCAYGSCQSGCREDEHCPEGQICGFWFDFTGDPIGRCIEGCRGNAECAAGEHCVCHSCARDACDSNDDCGSEEYCPTGVNELGVEPCGLECQPLPPPVTCGGALCRATSVFATVQEVPVPACCAGSTGGECGLETSALLSFAAPCQALDQPGEVDPSCGPDSGFLGGPLAACRRPDGKCGYRVDVLGLGCVAQDP